MFRRALGSAALASAILAADLVVLILFLNPRLTLHPSANCGASPITSS